MIENNKIVTETNENVVELTGSDKLTNKKRRIGALALSAAAMTAICISIAAAASSVPENASAASDLSDYTYTSEETAVTEAADTQPARRSADIPMVTLPDAVPEGYSTKSASVSSMSALGASPAVCDVTIYADGERYDVTAGGTVSDAIDRSGIEIGKYDIITPDVDTALTDDTVITVQRVQYVKVTTKKTVYAETEYVEDDTLPVGESMIVTEGCDGVLKKVYMVKRIDGEDVKAKLMSETVISEPVNTVIANGTYEETYEEDVTDVEYVEEEFEEDTAEEASEDYNIEAQPYTGEGIPASQVSAVSQFDVPADLILDENNVPLNYTQALHGKSCAYTASEGALMSTGKAVQQGYVAVNPKVIPYGTRMYIVADDGEVYGYAIAADTGGSVGRNDILVDLFMWSYDECIQWGAKNVTIYILPDEE